MQKQSVWILWIGCLVAWFVVGGLIGTIGRVAFGLLVVVHVAEFFVKRDVFARAGGSTAHHFVQTLIYGLFHWKPLEEAQSGSGDA